MVQAVARGKEYCRDVIPVARFLGIPESPRSKVPTVIEIPASHKTRAGMTRFCGVISAILQQPVKACGHDTS